MSQASDGGLADRSLETGPKMTTQFEKFVYFELVRYEP